MGSTYVTEVQTVAKMHLRNYLADKSTLEAYARITKGPNWRMWCELCTFRANNFEDEGYIKNRMARVQWIQIASEAYADRWLGLQESIDGKEKEKETN